jgi:hypothetical protein
VSRRRRTITSSLREIRVARLPALVLAFGLLAIAAAGLTVLLQSSPRRAGTNLTSDVGLAIHLPPGQALCEPGELIPEDTAALALHAGAGGHPAPALNVVVRGPHGVLSTGSLAAGWRPGAIRIPLRRLTQTVGNATVCVNNAGSSEVDFGGSVPSGFAIDLAGKPLLGRLRIEYMRPGSETWLQFAPALVRRFSLAKSDLLRHWEWAAVLILMFAAVGLAARTIVSEGRS